MFSCPTYYDFMYYYEKFVIGIAVKREIWALDKQAVDLITVYNVH